MFLPDYLFYFSIYSKNKPKKSTRTLVQKCELTTTESTCVWDEKAYFIHLIIKMCVKSTLPITNMNTKAELNLLPKILNSHHNLALRGVLQCGTVPSRSGLQDLYRYSFEVMMGKKNKVTSCLTWGTVVKKYTSDPLS